MINHESQFKQKNQRFPPHQSSSLNSAALQHRNNTILFPGNSTGGRRNNQLFKTSKLSFFTPFFFSLIPFWLRPIPLITYSTSNEHETGSCADLKECPSAPLGSLSTQLLSTRSTIHGPTSVLCMTPATNDN